MVEIPGSEDQLRDIVFNTNLKHSGVLIRKTIDSDGNDYILILNGQGDEVAEWDEDLAEWQPMAYPRPTGTIENTTDLNEMLINRDKQALLGAGLGDEPGTTSTKIRF